MTTKQEYEKPKYKLTQFEYDLLKAIDKQANELGWIEEKENE